MVNTTPEAMKLYTGVQAEDIYRVRAWVTIPFRDSLATTAPLRKLIADQIDRRHHHRGGDHQHLPDVRCQSGDPLL